MTTESKSAAELAVETKALFDKRVDEVKAFATDLEGRLGKGEDLTKSAKELADQALAGMNEAKARLDELEQKAARPSGRDGEVETKGYGEQLTDSSQYKGFVERGSQGSMRLEVKAVTSANNSGGGLIYGARESDPVALAMRGDFVLRDLLTVAPIATGSVEFPKQASRTNNAAPVAEGAAKPYSDYGWTKATVNVRTIAHLAKLTRQALDDAPRLRAEVDAEMRYGLGLKEDQQILLGDGTGENLTGLMPNATAYALPSGAATPTTGIDKLRAAVLQQALTFYPATGIVLHPVDWYNIELTKDSAGGYILANPMGMASPRLWSLPVAATVSQTVGAFLTGNFKMAATLYDRMAVEVLISSENVDDFEKNLYTMRAEERLALAIKRPLALTKGTF